MDEKPSASDHADHEHESDHGHDHDDHGHDNGDHHEEHGHDDHDHHEHDSHEHEDHGDVRRRGGFIITGLTGGHGVFHWFSQSFNGITPVVQTYFGLSGAEIGGIHSAREIASGIVTLPGGVIADALRRYWGLILALCMAGFGLGWLIIGLAPAYPVLIAGMVVVGIASSLWHLPAMASLSHHFSHRRGAALSFHGVGGQVGDALAPPVTGFLLGFMAWKELISIYAAIPLFLAFLVYWSFRHIGRDSQDQEARPGRGEQWQTTKAVLRNPVLWLVSFVGGVRAMAFLALFAILPLTLRDLGMSVFVWNLHLGLLMGVGILSTPVVGYLSDRYGRKQLLIPGMIFLGIMSFALSSTVAAENSGLILTLVVALLGLFLFGDQPILTALALDVAGGGVATTVLGILSFARFIMAAGAPWAGGYIYDTWGADITFLCVAILFIIGAVVLFLVRAPTTDRVAVTGHDH